MSAWYTILINIITLLISCWVLYEAREARRVSEAQLKLTTEPDFKLNVDGTNSDSISINCRNWGARVTDMKHSIRDHNQ